MTILSALERLYSRMDAAETDDVPRFGYSRESISFAVVLDANGRPLRLADKRSHAGKKPAPAPMNVPVGDRTSGIKPNLLWDKTAYVFGVVAIEEKGADGNSRVVPGQRKRTAQEHAAFVDTHRDLLAGATDPGLAALRRFLECWRPGMFAEMEFNPEALDQNVVFEFDDGCGTVFVHERPAAIALFDKPSENPSGPCLVTGAHAPTARLHPKIKRVKDAQPTGASLVSFNENAYESFGKSKGENAPVSERAAHAYVAALNALLADGSERRLQVGDATIVFWAEADRQEASSFAEMLMAKTFRPPDEAAEAMKLKAAISDVAAGRFVAPEFDPATRIHILGLAPNAARLSVRFWHPGTFDEFARHVAGFWASLDIDPSPWKGPPAAWSLLYETAIQVGGKPKADTVPQLLGGQLMRSVLTGQPLPRTLLSAVIARIRTDGEINGRRAAICKAVINRTTKEEEVPVSLDPDNPNPAYRLGRLFAVLESAQRAALGKDVNATIKDRFFASASATPARVFPLLLKNTTHHLALLKKDESRRWLGNWMEGQIGAIWLGLEADMPRTLTLEEQGRFIAGYYHQRCTKTKKDETEDGAVKPMEKIQ